MTQFITGAPVWVWPLLALLVFIGLRARHERRVPVFPLYILAALGVLGVRSTLSLPAESWIWGVFLVCYAFGGWCGFKVQKGWLLAHDGQRAHLAGESLTLCVLLLIFSANFIGGALQAVAPDVYADAMFHIAFALVLGTASGSFLGRALLIWSRAPARAWMHKVQAS
ncbi:hypothetical protein [Sulfitobacter donghicola]|uniref:DUF1453 domain-containing protein n=1 Tax=Sulfitobacter donghicola DSW-25 = KCTC 12864 = JCM 14565 TaxID=1300350 RepID=A0A073IVH7_9RHOB|nr:hypothetical protein [Sulfitobacter donghicola]KEJ89387.1 hypothetical protein DSW25_10275 [Sulfitobacter donghicola DSW-25 = KCTC 12864 = JCM 14565]